MKIIITTFILLISLTGFNQEEKKAFEPKTSTISIGYGRGNYVGLHYLKESKKNDSLTFNSIGSFHGKYEYQLNKNTSIGASFAYKSSEINSGNPYSSDSTYGMSSYFDTWSINLRVNKFFAIREKSTFYYGFGLGYRNQLTSTYYRDSSTNFKGKNKENSFNTGLQKIIYQSPIEFEATIGFRHKFTKNIGIYAEIGLAKGFVQGGIIFNTTNTAKSVNKKPKKEFESFGNNAHIFSGGIGLSSFYLLNSNRISISSSVVNIKYEYGASEEFGFGINIASYDALMNYKTDNSLTNGRYEYDSYSTTSIIFRVNYHPVVNKKTDFYVGGGIGYRYARYNEVRNNDFITIFPVGFELTAGMRYYPIEHLGFYTEIGLAKAIIQGGVIVSL